MKGNTFLKLTSGGDLGYSEFILQEDGQYVKNVKFVHVTNKNKNSTSRGKVAEDEVSKIKELLSGYKPKEPPTMIYDASYTVEFKIGDSWIKISNDMDFWGKIVGLIPELKD